jgi:hypothetical protein
MKPEASASLSGCKTLSEQTRDILSRDPASGIGHLKSHRSATALHHADSQTELMRPARIFHHGISRIRDHIHQYL